MNFVCFLLPSYNSLHGLLDSRIIMSGTDPYLLTGSDSEEAGAPPSRRGRVRGRGKG